MSVSRQVGAALIDPRGNLLATGTNEVPRAGGGLYGEELGPGEQRDHRCAYKHRYCSSTREQNTLIDELVTLLVEAKATTPWHLGRVSYVELEAKLAQIGREIQLPAEPSGSGPTDAT